MTGILRSTTLTTNVYCIKGHRENSDNILLLKTTAMSKSPSLRRIQADVRELAMDPSDRYHAAPLENDMFEWYGTRPGPVMYIPSCVN